MLPDSHSEFLTNLVLETSLQLRSAQDSSEQKAPLFPDVPGALWPAAVSAHLPPKACRQGCSSPQPSQRAIRESIPACFSRPLSEAIAVLLASSQPRATSLPAKSRKPRPQPEGVAAFRNFVRRPQPLRDIPTSGLSRRKDRAASPEAEASGSDPGAGAPAQGRNPIFFWEMTASLLRPLATRSKHSLEQHAPPRTMQTVSQSVVISPSLGGIGLIFRMPQNPTSHQQQQQQQPQQQKKLSRFFFLLLLQLR